MAGRLDAPSDSPATRGVSPGPVAPVAEPDSSEVPIDPILLAESQSQLSRHPPSVLYCSLSSQACQGQVTGVYISALVGDMGSGNNDENGGSESESDNSDNVA